MTGVTVTDPDKDCGLCSRLADFRNVYRNSNPDWHNAPVDTWIPTDGAQSVEVLIVGLAPGLQGANRTGRPFTGDYAGDLLYATLEKFGYTVGHYGGSQLDGMELRDCAITNAVRCVPPQNKPIGAEINNCRAFLSATINRFDNLRTIVTLGKISHDSTVRALGAKPSQCPFSHNVEYTLNGITIIASYHCSRYNTNTGRLTAGMFEEVFRKTVRQT